MKLSAWKRIGIIASVVWMLGAGLKTYGSMNAACVGVASIEERSCEESSPHSNWDKCFKQFQDRVATCNAWPEAVVVAIVPVPFAWGFVYLILFLVRWVKRGFSS
jgi:hypothetical protein